MRCGRTASQSRSSSPASRPSSGAWRTQPDGCARMERCGAERSQRVAMQSGDTRHEAWENHRSPHARLDHGGSGDNRSDACLSARSLVNFGKRRDDYGGFTEGRLCRNSSIASGGRRRAARAKARTQSTGMNCGSVRLDYRLHWAAHAILVAIPGYSCTRPWSSKLSRAWKSNLGEA